ncbi:hypothetical protein ACFY48_09145 [Streptomyces coeruleorubidus]|uniref:hypothetical protein n=1 Tax=Streptomyces coeruleorubidus TaxID=116188 RepID=UPI0036A2202B
MRTTNPIETAFATVRPRTTVTESAGYPAAPLAMVFTLVESARQRWRNANVPHLAELPEAVVA